eukprot:GHRQ01000267.1.p1 GENE.GHRQ01000267.1~~GHRQ01000267.1.p1  ORF type:complete len:688 (+),score=265.24 GHRQ01000267.1:2028-4091(+)
MPLIRSANKSSKVQYPDQMHRKFNPRQLIVFTSIKRPQPHDVTHITVSSVIPSHWTCTLGRDRQVHMTYACTHIISPIVLHIKCFTGCFVYLLQSLEFPTSLLPCCSLPELDSSTMIGLNRTSRPCGRPQMSSAATFRRQVINASRRPAVRVLAFANDSTLKSASQPYIRKFAAPLNKAALNLYKFHEDVFDQLLLTPELDRKLVTGDNSTKWAAASVEAAVAEAIRIAYSGDKQGSISLNGSSSSSSGNSSGAFSSLDAVRFGDGMGAVLQSQPSSGPIVAAAAVLQQQQPAAADATAPGGCKNDDEECEVDWDALFASPDAYQQAGTEHKSLSSKQLIADDVEAAGAAKVEAATNEPLDVTAAHSFLQRLLYKINRLNHFWYDDLRSYENERSIWLASLRDTIEAPWQAWEQQQMEAAAAAEAESADEGAPSSLVGLEAYRAMSPEQMKEELKKRYARDVDPPLSPAQQYVVDGMGPLGYCHLLAVGSVDGLVEASRQSRVCAGAANEVACAIFRVLMEEYGTGRYSRKHSTFYKAMMEELGLDTKEEAYLDLLPWQWLAGANQNFLITERRRHYLRYAGALTFFEINGPSVYKTYLAAGKRSGLSDTAAGYWALHIKEDERHGRQMLEEVALPLVDMYPKDAWEMLLGYDQDRFMGARAGSALVAYIQAADQMARQMTAAGASA